MRLASLNAWGGQVWPDLGEWARKVQADILCLQEVTRAPVPSPAWLTYRDQYRALDQRTDLFADVSGVLPEYQSRFAAATRGTLEDGQGHAVCSEHGIAFWVRRDLAITEMQQCFIHGHFRHDGWGPEPVPRAFQIARICDPTSGKSFAFAHLHGLRDPTGKRDTQARKDQSKKLVSAISQFVRPNEPFILAGDFNLLPESKTFAALRELGLTELVSSRGHLDTRTTLYAKSQRFADYLLVSKQLNITAFDVPATPEVSDHRPLILDFEV